MPVRTQKSRRSLIHSVVIWRGARPRNPNIQCNIPSGAKLSYIGHRRRAPQLYLCGLLACLRTMRQSSTPSLSRAHTPQTRPHTQPHTASGRYTCTRTHTPSPQVYPRGLPATILASHLCGHLVSCGGRLSLAAQVPHPVRLAGPRRHPPTFRRS